MQNYYFQDFRRRWARWSLVCALGLAGIARAAADAMPVAMPEDLMPGLKAVLKSALEQSPRMITSGLDLAKSEADFLQSRSAQLPSANLSLGYQYAQVRYQDERADGSRVWRPIEISAGPTYFLSVYQPVYHWGALQAQTDIAKLTIKMRERSYEEAYLALANSVRSQYMLLIQKKLTLDYTTAQLAAARRNLELLEGRLTSGQVGAGVVSGAKLAIVEMELALERMAADYASSLKILLRLCGQKSEEALGLPVEVPKVTYAADVTKAYLNGQQNWNFDEHTQIATTRYELEQQKLNYDIAKVRLRPKIGTTISYSQNSVNSGVAGVEQALSASASISANWALFDGYATRGAKLSALASIRSAERRLGELRQDLADRMENLRKEIDFAGRRLKLVQDVADGSEAAITRAKDQLKLGQGSQSEVDAAELGLQAARVSITAARAEFLNKWTEYVSLLGLDPVAANLPNRFIRNVR